MPDPRLPRLYCKRCGYMWIPRKSNPHVCPKCKNPKWDIPVEDVNPQAQREAPTGNT